MDKCFATAIQGLESGRLALLTPNVLGGSLTFEPNKTLEENWEGEATALKMFPRSLPKQFIAREGEAPAEPLQPWLGNSLALPKVLTGRGFAKMFTAESEALLASKKERPMVFTIGLFVPWHRGKCLLTPVRSIKLYREALSRSNRPSNRYLTVMCCSNPGGRPIEHSRKFPIDDRAFLGS